ncbi:GNAT family N-acetyltransferase, partial [Enterococcus faecalis]
RYAPTLFFIKYRHLIFIVQLSVTYPSLYALLIGNTIVSICIVDYSSENNYLYGLAVLKKYQRQGIGSYLVKEIINQMIKENNKRFQIAVEDSNITAKIMYEKLGFVFQTQVVYLNENES